MPELPEVETIVRGISGVVGKQIQAVYLLWNRTLQTPILSDFTQRVTGQSIQGVSRRGKFIIIHLEKDFLLVHLRMSGDLRLSSLDFKDGAPQLLIHDRMVLSFSDGSGLFFNDARKFGRIWLVKDYQEVTGGLGPEPLAPDFTPKVLLERLRNTKRQIKPLLLDQTFLAGMGNIYTDEALNLAKIHPMRLSSSLQPMEVDALWLAIRQVLQAGIDSHGASIDWVYRGGDFQNHFRVYQRSGQSCPECGTGIQRIVVGQRGTHFCPTCQPAP